VADPVKVRLCFHDRCFDGAASSAVFYRFFRERIQPGADDTSWAKGVLPNARFVELADYAADLVDAAPKTLAKQINAFLKGEGSPRAAQ